MEEMNPLGHLHSLVIPDASTATKFRYRLAVRIVGMPKCHDLFFSTIFDGKPEFARDVREKFLDIFPFATKRVRRTRIKKAAVSYCK